MHQISVKNFGPINEIVMMDIRDYMIVIGEEATGKSTLAKLIYFFRSIKLEIYESLLDNKNEDQLFVIMRKLRYKFINIFGRTGNRASSTIQYFFSKDNFVNISLDKIESIKFSNNLMSELQNIWAYYSNIKVKYDNILKEANDILAFANISSSTILANIQKDMSSKLSEIFSDEYIPYYIPSGRAFLAIENIMDLIDINERKQMIYSNESYHNNTIDTITRSYVDTMRGLKQSSIKDVIDFIDNYANANSVGSSAISYYAKTLQGILKGQYIFKNGREFIKTQSNKLVPIANASSGQQEVYWILNFLTYLLMSNQKVFIVFEEPEAHLYPNTQYMLMQLIALFLNVTESQMFITTHSPYIIMSTNNLLYAGKTFSSLGDLYKSRITTIIPDYCWLNWNKFEGLLTHNGGFRKIYDNTVASMDISTLDNVASIMDDDFDKLSKIRQEKYDK